MLSVVNFLLLVSVAIAREFSDEEYSLMPRLFHLDDYDNCLAKTGGLYCLGTFQITPPKQPNPTYDLIKEYSEDQYHFNRTQLHRGYCVSSRCPATEPERNTSLRFEHCTAQWGRKYKLRIMLQSLQYCRTYAQEYARKHNPEPLDISHRAFLAVIALLAALNVIGTLYDVIYGDNKKSSMLVMWSIRNNWRRLTATHEDGDPRLSALVPVQGVRVLLMVLIIGAHAGCIHDKSYLFNPRYIEQVAREPFLMLFLNGTSVVQVFILVSSFLLAYNVLLYSKDHKLNMGMLPICIIKRILRITPVYLLVVSYAATWWPHASSGPLWPQLVEAESAICRRKFWTHALYINNLVEPGEHCLVQTWFLAVDMQLYILASALTLWLLPMRNRALSILAVLISASCVLNGALAYAFNWESLMYFVYPETLRTMYRGISSFSNLYISPWGSLPACLMGLFLAYLHFDLQERGFKASSKKWLVYPYQMGPLLMISWILAGCWLRDFKSPEFTAAYVAIERPVLGFLSGLILFGMFNGIDNGLRRFFSWSGWHAMGRMSLSVLMVHWCMNLVLVASKPQPISTSLLDVAMDTVVTGAFTYLTAVPLTILVEMPVQRYLNAVLDKVVVKRNT